MYNISEKYKLTRMLILNEPHIVRAPKFTFYSVQN